MPLQVRRGPTADRTSFTPVIGELIYDTVEKTLYVGDGATPGGVASSSFTFEDAQDASAALFTSGVHSNINFSYNDTAARIDASIDLTNYSGVIEADGLKGSVFAADSTLLVDSVLASFNLDGTVRTDIVPFASEAYDLGTPTNKFKDLYLSGSSLWLGDAQITASGPAVNLPTGSTIGGFPIGSGGGGGIVEGNNYIINIIGEDSSTIVDSSTGSITAPGGIVGDLTGSVFGDDSSIIISGIDNSINTSVLKIYDGNIEASNGKIELNDLNPLKPVSIQVITQGVFGGVPEFAVRAGKGNDIDSPENTEPGDNLNQINFQGYFNGQWKNAVSLYASWGANADLNSGTPTSQFAIITGKDNSPNYAIFTAKGALTIPILQPTAFVTVVDRDTAITDPEEGMITYVTELCKFQGYVTDTGLAAGSSSNSTPGWINLN